MEKHSYNDDELDRYLSDEMNAEERQAFEQQLDSDASLADDLALQRDAIEGIRLDGSQNLKKQLQAIEAELATGNAAVENKKDNTRRLISWVAIAASVLAVILVGYLFIPTATDPAALYVAYYQPYPNLINPAQRSAEITEETTLEQALRAYNNREYERALRLFEQGGVSSAPGYTFYHAASYLGQDQPQAAIPLLERVIRNEDSLFYGPGLWYLALAHLKENNPDAAVPLLEKLALLDGDYSTEARELLEDIR